AGLTLRLYDIPSGKDVWQKTFPANAVNLRVEDHDLAGVVEPGGKVTVFDLRARREVLQATVEPAHLDKGHDGLRRRDGGGFYVVLNRQAEGNAAGGVQGPFANLGGLRAAPVNGMVYAFHPDGTLNWRTVEPILNQMLLLEQFEDLPVLVFTARY